MRCKDRVNTEVYLLSFALQQILVPATILVAASVVGQWTGLLTDRFYYMFYPAKIARYILPDAVGFVFGLAVSHLPAFIREPARHIWILPAALFAMLYSYSFFHDVHYLISLIPADPSLSGDPLAILLLIYPCAACTLYSVGVRSGDRQVEIDHAAVR